MKKARMFIQFFFCSFSAALRASTILSKVMSIWYLVFMVLTMLVLFVLSRKFIEPWNRNGNSPLIGKNFVYVSGDVLCVAAMKSPIV
jgi:ammonia channel protein AmtB